MKKILVFLAHPATETFNHALANAYEREARQVGHEVRRTNLGELEFDPILHDGYRIIQELEPNLKSLQGDIKWADHLVLVYPTWWFAPPALLKGFFDRALLPGFGFRYSNDGFLQKYLSVPKRLLKGKSARIICTSDGPSWLYKLLGHTAIGMVRDTLRFCGFGPIRSRAIGSVKNSDDSRRKKWLAQVANLGRNGK